MLFVCYPKCSTCAKAKKWLEENNIHFIERDIKAENPSAEELKQWHKKSNLALNKFFNTSGLQYKALGLKDKIADMTDEEKYDLLATDGMLVKRPIIVGDNFAYAGFKAEIWSSFLK